MYVFKLNVIYDCLGILIKEWKIYYIGNGYFVFSYSLFDKFVDVFKENGDVFKVEEFCCVVCEVIFKGKFVKVEKVKKKKKEREK